VTAHLRIPKSILAHLQNLSILFSWVWRDVTLLAKAAKSLAYAAEFILVLEVLKVYPLFFYCNQRNSDSKIIINRYGLKVSPCMIPLCTGISCVLPKYSPIYVVVDCE
jgi:hypothetical protein